VSAAPSVVIGRIGRPHGVRGAVHSRASGPTLATIAPGEALELRLREGSSRRLVLAARSGMDDRPILSLEGVATREEAALLTDAEILVPAARVPPVDDPDTFLVRDLIGCEVALGPRPLGPVREVHAAPANDVLEVATGEGPLLVPFTGDAVVDLDVPGRRIVLRADLLGTDPDS
jgi:16S rRNA processing protein RimM